jgi:hypothetical protein
MVATLWADRESTDVQSALKKCTDVFMPNASQGIDGEVTIASDEYDVIESSNPKVQGIDGATLSFVEYLYELAKSA